MVAVDSTSEGAQALSDLLRGGPGWRKSSFSGTGNCVEFAASEDFVLVRDSKDPQGSVLRFTLEEWRAFLKGASIGEFNV